MDPLLPQKFNQHPFCCIGSTNDDPSVKLASMSRNLPSAGIFRFVLVPILSLWIAGAGCIIGCEGIASAAATVPNSSQEMHSGHQSGRKATIGAVGNACSSSGSRSCCTKNAVVKKPETQRTGKSDLTRLTVGESSSGLLKDCPLAVGKTAIAAKIRSGEVAVGPVLAHWILDSEYMQERISPPSPPTRLPNREHTYLRCCVFLI